MDEWVLVRNGNERDGNVNLWNGEGKEWEWEWEKVERVGFDGEEGEC